MHRDKWKQLRTSSLLGILIRPILIRILLFALLIICLACQESAPALDIWDYNEEGVGSSSSPRAIDLNNDGIKDIVVGAGAKEFTYTKSAVIALDGATGELLWEAGARNQIVGSPIFSDINNDEIPDVFIGGRSAIFYALDGTNGEVIWEYLPHHDSLDYFNDEEILNFYTPQFIADVDGDSIKDILTSYGGFIKAQEKDLERPVGSIMILSGKTGEVISKVLVPDGKETYCSPVLINGDQGQSVVFGTGGEYINGHLYRADLKDILNNKLGDVVELADGEGKGFISPPIIVDANADGTDDIVAVSVNGQVLAFDGKTNEILWRLKVEGDLDTYAMPGVGYLYGFDKIPDYFVSLGKGAWPFTEYTIHCLIEGNTGNIVFTDTLGTFQYASPVVADVDADGSDDVILAINDIVRSDLYGSHMKFQGNDLMVYPQKSLEPFKLFETKLGTNLGSTPLLTDLDGDGLLDIISIYMADPVNFYSFSRLVVNRTELNIAADAVSWGGYMGGDGSAYFKVK